MEKLDLYASGIHSVLLATWKLTLATPLVIRSGTISGFKSGDNQPKSRYQGAAYRWNEKQDPDFNNLGDLNMEVTIAEDQARPVYRIPAKSLRGALRTWTLARLAPPEVKNLLARLPELDDEKATACITDCSGRAVADYLRGLFGLAGKDVGETEGLSSRGRLSLNSGPILAEKDDLTLSYAPLPIVGNPGPTNGRRQVAVRGPVCRFTQAAKHGGLHQYLEFAAGQAFEANLRIVNPQAEDHELLEWWRHELNAGFLRLGGLSSIGRGRLKVDSGGIYACEPRRPPWWPKPQPVPLPPDDPFEGLWRGYALPEVEGYPNLTTLTQDAHADAPA